MGLTALGGGALVLALVAACATAVARGAGAVDWGRRGLAAVFGLVTVGVVALAWALVGQDYSLVYVADHASRDTTWPYRLAGLWGGMAGSLLLWTWMLAGWALLASRSVRRRLPELAGGTQAVLAVEAAVFLGLLVTVSRPFATLAVPAIDGGGLTPILRHPAMLYHPPLLYSGYVGLAVPAAMAVAALVSRTAGDWLAVARRYMVASLVLLAVGMTAGAHWAYVELGMGRLLGVGPGGERRPPPLAGRRRLPPLRPGRPPSPGRRCRRHATRRRRAPERRRDPRAGVPRLRAVAAGRVPHPVGDDGLGARLRRGPGGGTGPAGGAGGDRGGPRRPVPPAAGALGRPADPGGSPRPAPSGSTTPCSWP